MTLLHFQKTCSVFQVNFCVTIKLTQYFLNFCCCKYKNEQNSGFCSSSVLVDVYYIFVFLFIYGRSLKSQTIVSFYAKKLLCIRNQEKENEVNLTISEPHNLNKNFKQKIVESKLIIEVNKLYLLNH